MQGGLATLILIAGAECACAEACETTLDHKRYEMVRHELRISYAEFTKRFAIGPCTAGLKGKCTCPRGVGNRANSVPGARVEAREKPPTAAGNVIGIVMNPGAIPRSYETKTFGHFEITRTDGARFGLSPNRVTRLTQKLCGSLGKKTSVERRGNALMTTHSMVHSVEGVCQ